MSKQSPPFRLRRFSWANLAKYLRYCRTYGVQSATRLAVRKILRRGQLPGVMEPLPVPLLPDDDVREDVTPIRRKISVIIPTRNAGAEFQLLLRKLKAQTGIEQIEIVVVDSCSTDETVTLATAARAEVIPIVPESFSHSFSRNLGAERATGDYLLFMVQDALPLTQRWLWEMARTLEANNLAAVSCAEYPRADSDLFYRLLLWNHYRSLQLDRDRILQFDASCASTEGLRANAQISGISLLIRRDVFERYQYRGDYAEDLDLGIRLIREGHKIGFLYGTRVLHSHNRPAYYFLKRGYVDARNLAQVLPGFVFPQIRDAERLFGDISSLYQRLNSIDIEFADLHQPMSAPELIGRLQAQVLASNVSGPADTQVDPALDDFTRRLGGHAAALYDPDRNMILPHLMQHLTLLQEFLSGVYPQIDQTLRSEIRACVIKMFALHSGTHLAYLYLVQSADGDGSHALHDLDRELVQGV